MVRPYRGQVIDLYLEYSRVAGSETGFIGQVRAILLFSLLLSRIEA